MTASQGSHVYGTSPVGLQAELSALQMVFGSSAADIYCVRFCWDEDFSWGRGSSPPGPRLWGETMDDRYLRRGEVGA